MKLRIRTAHGYQSFQPPPKDGVSVVVQYRPAAGPWEDIEVEGLDEWLNLAIETIIQRLASGPAPGPEAPAPAPSVDDLNPEESAAFVARVKQMVYGNGGPIGVLGAFEICKHVAWGLRAVGAGLLLKPSGENIVQWNGRSYSASRICFPDGHIYKLLTDVPTTNGPSWQDNAYVDRSLYVPAIQP